MKSDLYNENEKLQYKSIRVGMDDETAQEALNNLSNYLSRYYGKKVIILLDEYDTPMQEAYVNGNLQDSQEAFLMQPLKQIHILKER